MLSHKISSFVFLALIIGGSFARGEVRKLRVEHYLQPSSQGGAKFCYVVSERGVSQMLDQPIEGFAWVWGTVYEITVNVERVQTGGGIAARGYTLLSVDSQTRVAEGTRFQIFLFDRSFIHGRTLLRQKAFESATPAVEAELKRRLENLAAGAAVPAHATGKQTKDLPRETGRVLLEFSHPKSASEPLILHSIIGADDLGLE